MVLGVMCVVRHAVTLLRRIDDIRTALNDTVGKPSRGLVPSNSRCGLHLPSPPSGTHNRRKAVLELEPAVFNCWAE